MPRLSLLGHAVHLVFLLSAAALSEVLMLGIHFHLGLPKEVPEH